MLKDLGDHYPFIKLFYGVFFKKNYQHEQQEEGITIIKSI
jgi:hypothetical protein